MAKADSKFTTWKKIISGVPKGPILCSILFNIFMCDIKPLITFFDNQMKQN